jgi:triacylglycerol lipase
MIFWSDHGATAHRHRPSTGLDTLSDPDPGPCPPQDVPYFSGEEHAAAVPIWREVLFGFEWLTLRASPVFYGWGVPRGGGAGVVVVPGFLGWDGYLLELYGWLWRIGYRPYLSRIGINTDCFDLTVTRLLTTIHGAYAATGHRVHLIAHSLGGVLCRAAAVRAPEHIASVITLGSTFRGFRGHPLVMQMWRATRASVRARRSGQVHADCFSGSCACQTLAALQAPPPPTIARMAIYTKSDGVADWRFCLDDDVEKNYEVPGTHIGLAFNPVVYGLIARQLAATTGELRARS